MAIEEFKPIGLRKLKSIGIKYVDSEEKSHVIDANIIFLSDNNLTVSFVDNHEDNLKPQQPVVLKYVSNNRLCNAETVVSDVKKGNGLIYFIIDYPKSVVEVNRRKYFRINLKRACVLICTDGNGNSKSFMSRLVDISIGGLLIHKLESMFSNEFVKIEPSEFKYFNIVLFLDIDVVLKLSARCVRQEKGRMSYRYGFEFTNIKKEDAEIIAKYVNKEQMRQRNLQNQ